MLIVLGVVARVFFAFASRCVAVLATITCTCVALRTMWRIGVVVVAPGTHSQFQTRVGWLASVFATGARVLAGVPYAVVHQYDRSAALKRQYEREFPLLSATEQRQRD